MGIQLQYPMFVIVRKHDLIPIPLLRDDGVKTMPVMETEEEADRLAESLGLKNSLPVDIRNPAQMRGVLLVAADHAGVSTVILPRGRSPESGDEAPEFHLHDVLQCVDQQLEAEKRAGLN